MTRESFFQEKETTTSACRSCGSSMPDHTSFCGYCGQAMKRSIDITQISAKINASTLPPSIPMTREKTLHPKNTHTILVLILAMIVLAVSTFLVANMSHPSAPASKSVFFGKLEDEASRWTTITVPQSISGKPTNVQDPSVDGKALKTSLIVDPRSESTLTYRNLGSAPTVTTFELNLSFFFPSATSLQALGFSTSQLVNHQRWEWALQWLNNPDTGALPSWKVWDGKRWQELGVTQALNTNTWHHLWLKGTITNGQIHYISFSCDEVSRNLNQTFAPVSFPAEDQLAVMVQLNRATQGKAYDVYMDEINLRWS